MDRAAFLADILRAGPDSTMSVVDDRRYLRMTLSRLA